MRTRNTTYRQKKEEEEEEEEEEKEKRLFNEFFSACINICRKA